MSVIGVCQSCGTSAPIEWFLADAEYRKMTAIVAELPREVAPLIFNYLSLFKADTSRKIQPRKAVRLATELKTLVAAGYVQVDRRVTRPCPPRIWALAIEQMIERRDRLTLPMPNHNYLKSIAWDLADKADAQQERSSDHCAIIRRKEPQHIAAPLNPLDAWIQGHREEKPTDEEMAAWRKARLEGN